jgi:hypothetical protein
MSILQTKFELNLTQEQQEAEEKLCSISNKIFPLFVKNCDIHCV